MSLGLGQAGGFPDSLTFSLSPHLPRFPPLPILSSSPALDLGEQVALQPRAGHGSSPTWGWAHTGRGVGASVTRRPLAPQPRLAPSTERVIQLHSAERTSLRITPSAQTSLASPQSASQHATGDATRQPSPSTRTNNPAQPWAPAPAWCPLLGPAGMQPRWVAGPLGAEVGQPRATMSFYITSVFPSMTTWNGRILIFQMGKQA